MKRSIVFSALVPFLFVGVVHAADGNVITEDGQLIIKATVQGSSCHFSSESGSSAIIDMNTISTSDVYKIDVGEVNPTKWNNDTDLIEIICPSSVALKTIIFDPTNFSGTYPTLLQDDNGDATGVGFSVDFHNSDSTTVNIDSKDKIVDVSQLKGVDNGANGVKYTLKFDAQWARLAQVVKAGDVKSTIKFTVETD
ncbi:fimbrial protein [Citrobacter sp. R-1.5.2]|uniref:fimbrial protein n=1 Tax=Citrobacter sp. R-1.5.2 TaxID=3046183 RepID=UPI002B24238D|nr:fimbrial protein [Citrobacter sp. R-1.5.2]MEB2417573.1 hypothetical protein [Citrobacter sp. R-1.5.2]